MKENKIFIDNFYDRSVRLGLKQVDTDEDKVALTGIHLGLNEKDIKSRVISEVFKALLLHDKIIISTENMLNIVSAFGIEDTISLLQTNRFETIDDAGSRMTLFQEAENKFILDTFQNAGKNSLEHIESRLFDNQSKSNVPIKTLLLNIEKNNTKLLTDDINKKIIKETQYDIGNSNVSNYLDLNSLSIKDIKQNDIHQILRLSKLNQTLIYSSYLDIDNMSIDGAVKPIINVKIPPSLKTPSVDLYDSIFKELFQKKGIPDLSNLYIKKTITIDDYLHMVSTFSGRKFRQWIMDKDYEQSQLEADILNSNPKITNKIVKFIRWTAPNAIGLIFPAAGIASSFTDSFIIEKLMGGWHPNFFLDDIMKKEIDKKLAIDKRNQKLAYVKNKFPNVGRNDPCPCGSTKKFKQCCGK